MTENIYATFGETKNGEFSPIGSISTNNISINGKTIPLNEISAIKCKKVLEAPSSDIPNTDPLFPSGAFINTFVFGVASLLSKKKKKQINPNHYSYTLVTKNAKEYLLPSYCEFSPTSSFWTTFAINTSSKYNIPLDRITSDVLLTEFLIQTNSTPAIIFDKEKIMGVAVASWFAVSFLVFLILKYTVDLNIRETSYTVLIMCVVPLIVGFIHSYIIIMKIHNKIVNADKLDSKFIKNVKNL